ncbi:metal ABC transporter substrate-binding protein [Nocardia sp. NEAU-G5]|uniref:Metal ABC transporter substrate-binding protein n=1 Tax=Nocardia albiluteola TaxID=2842303 RepID=A0ABS6B6G6_9NOCA|nr:metal ABC transporter substrate-binding protein [Nocardia albiluteola]MBU3065916.1 metal ABC transporter substrate-binding protein [Nocardia albiluteola]
MVPNTRRRFVRLGIGVVALITGAEVLAGCGSGQQDHGSHTGPHVVAASSWEAAFAEAAGATDVTVIVPPSIKHAPDYDPKPSDLAAVSKADFVLYAQFEGFASKIKDAAGSKAKVLQLNLDNSRDNVVKQVRTLGDAFGTRASADRWIQNFGTEYDTLAGEAKAAWRDGQPPKVVAETFMGFAAQLSGAQVLGTYGPEEVTAKQVADLSATKPQFVFSNAQMDTGTVLPGTSATQIALTNYPTQGYDLLSVYRDAESKIVAVLKN